ncbi:MAG: trypsin-like peptidase domain-containing protein [Calditrichaceae bacterium]|nr:trypsin-like peptidase domain-containing protein [Calditrichaceae bacterium]
MKILKPIILIVIGLIIGLILYNKLGVHEEQQGNIQDSSIVTSAHAQDAGNSGDTDQTLSASRHNAITRAVEKVSPAVVSVNVTKVRLRVQRNPYVDPFFREFFPEFFGDRRYQQYVQSVGSGFIISKDGYILTNHHVVEDAAEIIVAKPSGDEYPAEIIGSDPISDVALLKIKDDNHHYTVLGNSDDLIIGEWAIALGNPFGLFVTSQPTVTVGVISATDRDFSRQQGRVYEDMIQTDASINHGNSGGPLCNANGEVIGMNTFIYTGDTGSSGFVGIGFAIPINRITNIIDDLKNKRQVDRDIWIGLYVANLSRFLARQLQYPSTQGVYVARIAKNSPAEDAGIKLGDIITQINNREIKNDRDAEEVISSTDLKVGDELKLRIWRSGKELNKTLILGKRNR